jgi:elongation factor G
MKEYKVSEIRNIGIIAHGSAGKTSLAEAMLYDTGAADRLGKVVDGSTIMDYEPEEIKRQMTISSSVAFTDWRRHKINIIDTPGDANFLAEALTALRVVDAAVVVVNAVAGLEVQLDRLWNEADLQNKPRLIFLNKSDMERANFHDVIKDLGESFSQQIVPLQLPLGMGESFQGVIDLLSMKAYIYEDDESGQRKEAEIPQELTAAAESLREKLVESVAEMDDDLVEKYLDTGELSEEEIKTGLQMGTASGSLVPLLCGAATRNMGVDLLLDAVVDLLPSPAQTQPVVGVSSGDNGEATRSNEVDEPFSCQVFKTVADPYAGKLTLFRVYSGVLSSDSSLYNSTQDIKERVGQIFHSRGKEQIPVGTITAGDIGTVAKLKATITGDTLCDEKNPIKYEPFKFQEPVISVAIIPKSKGDEDKVSSSLARVMEEDPTVRVGRDPQTRQMIVSGMGEMHLDVVIERLKRRFGVEVDVETPRVPYRETIKGSSKAQGKYKKQTGGRGQYGDTWLEVEPLPRGQGFEFVDKIVGGVIPKNYIPAVEKGVVETMEEGVLAGYPVVDVKVTLFDGSFHQVDSSDMAFKIAASMGFKKAIQEARPTLLEPIMNMTVTVPDDCMGDVIGDLNSRRGKVLGVEPHASFQVIKVEVPMGEVLKYSSALRSMTSGRGNFTMEFSRYEEVPAHISETIIQKAGKEE